MPYFWFQEIQPPGRSDILAAGDRDEVSFVDSGDKSGLFEVPKSIIGRCFSVAVPLGGFSSAK
jgi:hypothetical protein